MTDELIRWCLISLLVPSQCLRLTLLGSPRYGPPKTSGQDWVVVSPAAGESARV